MTKKLLIACATMALGAGVAACGSSKAPGIETAPSGGATTEASAAAAATSSTTPSTSTTPTATTPKTGPLASKPTVSVPSGAPPKNLVTKDLIKGTGKTATSGSTVTVNYVGVLYKGGKEFDSSWKRNQPFSTALSTGSVISGWVKGLDGMKVGGRRELIIPPSDGYGKTGSPPTIPANATLVFVVDLLGVS
ncbi:MAG TPA: FKBP-type peptidyl-prolyl cis-trans isomerase [Solirubrobacteraceae bacterium]|jgi:peptidylprolyl isomerase